MVRVTVLKFAGAFATRISIPFFFRREGFNRFEQIFSLERPITK